MAPGSGPFVLRFGWVRAALCSVIGALCATATASATPYEVFVDVDEEGDLQDLFAAGTLTDDTYNELLDLLGRGVDLNTADRNELYALPNLTYEDVDAILAFRQLQRGRITDPSALVSAGVISEAKLLAISSFLVVRTPGQDPLALRGFARFMTRGTPQDVTAGDEPLLPPLGVRARFTLLRHLSVGGVLTTTRLRPGAPVWDPVRGALVAESRGSELLVPKLYARWHTDKVDVIAGSFRAGFAQRLVFDNATVYTPNGLYTDDQLFFSADLATACKESSGELISSPCTGAAGSEYVTPDFVWRNGLLGGAVGARRLSLSTGWLQAYAFASASRRSIYQYELVNRGTCVDPHDDNDPGCAAPDVFVKPSGNLLDSAPEHSFQTLPDVFRERLVGGNTTYFADRRNSLGLTAYGAQLDNLVSGVDLDTQEWSRFPTGRRYGAVGASFSYGRGWLDVFGEGAASFDAIPAPDANLTAAKGGGGPAGILRATATSKHEELELVARYYATDYVNPYASPIGQPDEFEGQRARDEAGGRIRYIRTDKDVVVRALADVWVNPSNGGDEPKLDSYVRVNVRTTPQLWLGLWERYQDKDLSRGGNAQCYEIATVNDERGEPIPCGGRQITSIVRATYEPSRTYSGTLQIQHQLVDDGLMDSRPQYAKRFRQDLAIWFIGYYRPSKNVRTRIRARYFDEAIDDSTYLERSFATLVDTAVRVRDRDTLRVRFDTKFWLDNRATTPDRVPNPELTLWLFYEARL